MMTEDAQKSLRIVEGRRLYYRKKVVEREGGNMS